jgi:nucleosome binding factor SPN SPT16 subunit
MKTVNDDTYAFYEEGGWEFLTGGDDVSVTYCSNKAALTKQDSASSESSEGSVFGASSDGASSAASSEDSDSASDCEPSLSQKYTS